MFNIKSMCEVMHATATALCIGWVKSLHLQCNFRLLVIYNKKNYSQFNSERKHIVNKTIYFDT